MFFCMISITLPSAFLNICIQIRFPTLPSNFLRHLPTSTWVVWARSYASCSVAVCCPLCSTLPLFQLFVLVGRYLAGQAALTKPCGLVICQYCRIHALPVLNLQDAYTSVTSDEGLKMSISSARTAPGKQLLDICQEASVNNCKTQALKRNADLPM